MHLHNSQKMHRLILSGNIYNTILKLAIPIFIIHLSQSLYVLVDTYWVSKISEVELAALILIDPIHFFILSVGTGLSVAGMAIISRFIGSGDNDSARIYIGQLLFLTFSIAVILGITGYFTSEHIIHLMGGHGEMAENAAIHIKILCAGLPITYIIYVYQAVKQAEGNTLLPMVFMISSNILNMILDPIFIFTFNLGIAGAGYATLLSQFIFTGYMMYDLFTDKRGIKVSLCHIKPRYGEIISILKIAVLAIIGSAFASLYKGFLNTRLLSIGALEAFGVGNRILSMITFVTYSIGQSLAIMVGQNLGAHNIQRAKESLQKASIVIICFSVVSGLIMFLFRYPLADLFNHDIDIIKSSAVYLTFLAIGLPFTGMLDLYMGLFRGSGHTGISMALEVIRLWAIRIPLIIILNFSLQLGPIYVWASVVFSDMVACGIGFLLSLSKIWQRSIILETGVYMHTQVIEGVHMRSSCSHKEPPKQ